MKRRTLDVLFSVGGLMLAGLLLVLAVVMTSNANSSKTFKTPEDETFATPQPARVAGVGPYLAGI